MLLKNDGGGSSETFNVHYGCTMARWQHHDPWNSRAHHRLCACTPILGGGLPCFNLARTECARVFACYIYAKQHSLLRGHPQAAQPTNTSCAPPVHLLRTSYAPPVHPQAAPSTFPGCVHRQLHLSCKLISQPWQLKLRPQILSPTPWVCTDSTTSSPTSCVRTKDTAL